MVRLARLAARRASAAATRACNMTETTPTAMAAAPGAAPEQNAFRRCNDPRTPQPLLTLRPLAATLAVGTTLSFIVSDVASNGFSADLTNEARWTTDNPAVATVGAHHAGAIVRAVGIGAPTITASIPGRTSSAVVTVSAATVESIAVTPVNHRFPAGVTTQFRAEATYTDGTRQDVTYQADWSGGPNDLLVYVSARLAQFYADKAGTVRLTASLCTPAGTKTAFSDVSIVPSANLAAVNGSHPADAQSWRGDHAERAGRVHGWRELRFYAGMQLVGAERMGRGSPPWPRKSQNQRDHWHLSVRFGDPLWPRRRLQRDGRHGAALASFRNKTKIFRGSRRRAMAHPMGSPRLRRTLRLAAKRNRQSSVSSPPVMARCRLALTISFSSLPTLKKGKRLAGTGTGCPVRGLRPL
jgi:hypothetical protein